VTSFSSALKILDSFADEIPKLHPSPVLDYRGREITATSVREYLENEKFRFAEIASFFPNPSNPPTRLLDIGIAYGFLPALLKKVSSWQCEGLEIRENISVYCNFAQKNGIPIHAGALGMDPLPFPNETFRAVIFSEVLEHLRLSPSLVFKELHRIMSPQGILLVTTPNVARITNVVKLLLGKNISETFPDDVKTNNITDYLTHIREYTMGELVDLLRRNGFEPLETRYSSCMERQKSRSLLTQFVPPWRGNLMVLAKKLS